MKKRKTEKPELKPCPFCGGKAELLQAYTGGQPRRAYCGVCRIHGPTMRTAREAREAWNRRAEESAERQNMNRFPQFPVAHCATPLRG